MPARDRRFDRLHERIGRRRLVNRMAERQVDDLDAEAVLVRDGELERAMTSLVLPVPFLSSTLSARILTPGATPAYLPFDDAPLDPIRPATCVPWPYSSIGGVATAPLPR